MNKLLGVIAGLTLVSAVAVGAGVALFDGVTDKPALDANYGMTAAPQGGSHFAATLAASLRGEADKWALNKGFYRLSAYRIDTKGYNRGEALVLQRMVELLRDTLSRQNAVDDIDPRLQTAFECVNRGLDVWGVIGMGTFSTDGNFRKAADLIDAYNRDVASGRAAFYPRNDTISPIIRQMHVALGIEFARLHKIDQDGNKLSLANRAPYAQGIGAVKVVRDMLEALDIDFADVLHNQTATSTLAPSLKTANAILTNGIPAFVSNDASMVNHIGVLAGSVSGLMTDLAGVEAALGVASNTAAPTNFRK